MYNGYLCPSSAMGPKKKKVTDLLNEESCSDVDEYEHDLSREGKTIVAAIRFDVGQLRDEFVALLKENDKEIGELKSSVELLRTRVDQLEEKTDEVDAGDRRDMLLFSGEAIPPSMIGQNCTNILSILIKNKVKINIATSDISASYRQGRKPIVQGPDNRKIVMKLCRRDQKWGILRACREVRPNFYANENLTPTRNRILYTQ